MACRRNFRNLLTLLVLVVLSAAAQALPFRVYLASDGKDTNPCSVDAPCRLLPAALEAVADGGEIWMKDSANYGSNVTIGKSVTILAVPGALGSIVTRDLADAVTISADGLKVAMRNLTVVGSTDSTGRDGIKMTVRVVATRISLTNNVRAVRTVPLSGTATTTTAVWLDSSLMANNTYGWAVDNTSSHI